MRISAKGRYGLAAMIAIVQNHADNVPVTQVAEQLGLSKIYLEQIFSSLRKSGLVISLKGPLGGYRLAKDPEKITVYQILLALEQTLFEKTEDSFTDTKPLLGQLLQEDVFDVLDQKVKETLDSITLKELIDRLNEKTLSSSGEYMYYI